MSASTSQGQYDCPHCGALVDGDWTQCWLCRRGLAGPEAERPQPTSRRVAASHQRPSAGNIAIGASVAAAVVVWLGVTALAPGVGILMLVAILPAVVRTAMVTHRRSEEGKATSRGRTVLMLILSLVLTGTMLCVTAFVAFWTFCLTCVGAAAVTGFEGDSVSGPIIAASIVTLGVVSLLIWAFSKLVRARYYQDITKQ